MGWDEALFARLLRTGTALLGRKPVTPEWEARAELQHQKARLTILARALSGEALEIREAEKDGGYSGSVLFFPAEMDLFSTPMQNENAYLLRAAYSVFSRARGATVPAGLDDAGRRDATLRSLSETLTEMERELPGTAELRKSLDLGDVGGNGFGNWSKLWGLLQQRGDLQSGRKPNAAGALPAASLPDGTEKKGKAREKVEVIELSEKNEDENPLVHSFEKVHTADEYEGGKKSLDGSDEMADHGDALDEVDFRKVIRTRERARSLFRADPLMEGSVPDLEEGNEVRPEGFLYDEWAGKAYRKKWCTVHVENPTHDIAPSGISPWANQVLQTHRRELIELRNALSRVLTERAWRNRQLDGAEIDLEAVVDRFCTLRSGHSPSERLYLQKRRRDADFATLILIDASLSTDSWISNRRVMDVARESVLILGESLSGIHENSAVASFFSNTRRDCRFQWIKGFAEPWQRAHSRLASLEPAGYTRIGPAIRHSIEMLSRNPARKKLLLLLSDGKPTDYDRYEGKYGIDDVRQSIREAGRAGVKVQALAVDAQAKNYLPRMFGNGNYQILNHPAQLPGSLAKIYRELLK